MFKINMRFFTIAEYNDEQNWLENQHKKGWKLKLVLPLIFIFEKCNPEDVIYQLDYKNKSMTEDYFEIFKDYGWEYCGSCLGWNYFRKLEKDIETENDREIFSDADSKIDMINYIYKTRMLPLTLLLFAMSFWMFKYIKLIYGFREKIMFTLIFILFLVDLCIFIRCGLKLRKLKKELGE